jgi:hypothetical protein
MSLFIQPRRKIQGLDHLVFREEMMYIILILKKKMKRERSEKKELTDYRKRTKVRNNQNNQEFASH